jgi:Protein of unknown function (DUF3237)
VSGAALLLARARVAEETAAVPTDRLQLRPLIQATATAETVAEMPATPRGTARVHRFGSFECTGDRLTASLNPTSAAEWAVEAPDGTASADGRVTLTTPANETVYMRWVARWDASVDGPTPPRIVAMFEAVGELAWLNKIVAAGAVRQDGRERRYELSQLVVGPDREGDTPADERFEPLFTLQNTVDIANAISLEATVGGHRLIGAVTAADCRGPRIRAHLHGTVAGDWATLSPERSVAIDVTETFETDDGALVHFNYRGSGDVSGGGYSAPTYAVGLFETGDARYSWLNTVLSVGEGRHEIPEVVEYHYYAVR